MNKRAPNDPSESQILKSILDWLAINGIFHARRNTGAMTREYKGKVHHVRFNSKGMADIWGIAEINFPAPKRKDFRSDEDYMNALSLFKMWEKTEAAVVPRHFEIEVKRKGGKQSPEQKEFQKRVQAAGGIYILAYSLDDVREVLG